MIKNLQNEIQEINVEIEKENDKMLMLKEKSEAVNRLATEEQREFVQPVRIQASMESVEETMKELDLQKEDTTMKKVMVQMLLMKQIAKKKEENSKLGLALKK